MRTLTTTFNCLLKVSQLSKCCLCLSKSIHNTPNFYKTNFELKAEQIVLNRPFK